MQPEKFVEIIRTQIIKENLEIYKQILENGLNNSITDDYWKEVMPFFNKLNSNEKETLFNQSTFSQVVTKNF